jgi:hypothetical protein
MDTPSVITVIGGIALLVALFGGGIKAKEIEIPSIPGWLRILSGLIGIVLLISGVRIYLVPSTQPFTTTPTVIDISTSASASTSLPATAIPQIQATNTPEAIPSSTLTVETVTSLYDDFNDTAFDGSYDKKKWILDTASGNVFQHNGTLEFQLDTSIGDTISLAATKYHEATLEYPTFFEAKLMVPQAQSGHLFMLMTLYPSGAYTDCLAGGSLGGAAFGCGYTDKISPPITDYERLIDDYGKWHTARIEIEPSTMTITYYIDGEEVRSLVPPNAEKLKSEKITFGIGFFSDVASPSYIGYVDDVRIGAIGQ